MSDNINVDELPVGTTIEVTSGGPVVHEPAPDTSLPLIGGIIENLIVNNIDRT